MPNDGSSGDGGPLGRVLGGNAAVLSALAGLSGADLTTLLLEAMRRRARELTPPQVLRRYHEDRFATPASIPFHRLRQAEDRVLSALPPGFEVLTLAPVIPLGTHSVIATVDQNKVLSTIRGSEVAADPTNALALEAASRRRGLLQHDQRSAAAVRLAATQRVVRAQRFSGPASSAHFTLLGAVSAGRDTGNLAFERQHTIEHLRFVVGAVRASVGGRTEVRPHCPGTAIRSRDRDRSESVIRGSGRRGKRRPRPQYRPRLLHRSLLQGVQHCRESAVRDRGRRPRRLDANPARKSQGASAHHRTRHRPSSHFAASTLSGLLVLSGPPLSRPPPQRAAGVETIAR